MKISLALLLCTLSPASVTAALRETPDQEELEARFEELLTDCRLVGSFTLDGAPAGTAPKEDSYVIREVIKVDEGQWNVTAELDYGTGKIPVDIVVGVEWAGDTPVMLVTEKEIPMAGTYSARVLFHQGRYAGTWSGTSYGGAMFGRVVRADEADGERSAPPKRNGKQGDGKESGGSPEGPSRGAADDQLRTGSNWPSFRGPGASGVADGYPLPVEWDLESDANVRWVTPIAGLAHSSPVVWGERVFLTTAMGMNDAELTVGLYGSIDPVPDEGEQMFLVMCLDKRDGSLLWERVANSATPVIKRHPKGSHAASSPATDGRYVVSFFGSEGLYCHTVEGDPVWEKDLGILDSGFYLVPGAQWGFASSPVIHEDKLIVLCDVQEDSFLACLRLSDGEELWRTPREDVPTWGTPTVDVREGRSQIVVNGWKHIGGYDLETGAELWKLAGGGDIPVPTPVFSHDKVFITNAHGRMAPILAIEAGAEGELSMDPEEHEAVAWAHTRRGNYMQTPLVYGDLLYCCSDGGILRTYEVETGVEVYQERLGAGGGGFTGSAVAGDGKLYLTSEVGEVFVLRAGREFELLATNDLGETFMSTPAISEGVLYFRTRGNLVAVGLE